MISLSEIQNLRQTITQIQNSVITAQAQYDAAKKNIIQGFNQILELLSEEERIDFFAEPFSQEPYCAKEGDKITDIQDTDTMNNMIDFINNLLTVYDKTLDESYNQILEKVNKWKDVLAAKEA